MKTRLLAVLAGAALAIGAGVMAPAPASAHNQDAYSYWYCSYHRSAASATVVHSQVYGVWPGTIGYWCIDERAGGDRRQFWVAVSPPFSGVQYSWRPYPYQHCYPHGAVICQTH